VEGILHLVVVVVYILVEVIDNFAEVIGNFVVVMTDGILVVVVEEEVVYKHIVVEVTGIHHPVGCMHHRIVVDYKTYYYFF
jgi:hypothetical protein